MGNRCFKDKVQHSEASDVSEEDVTLEELTPRPTVKKEVVFNWNLDIFTTVMVDSSPKDNKDHIKACIDILTQDIAAQYFFYNNVKDIPMVNIYDSPIRESNKENLSLEEKKRFNEIISMQRRIRENYCKKCKNNAKDLISKGKKPQWNIIKQNMETLQDDWLSETIESLQIIHSRSSCVNILLTTGHLIPGLAQLILLGLGDIFSIENIYSTAQLGKEKCLQRISSQFDGNSNVFVFGVDKEDEQIAEKLKMAFWKVADKPDIDSLHHALTLNYL